MTGKKCEFCKIWLPIIIILIMGFYVTYQFVPPAAPSSLRIATGSKEGAYYQYAQKYKKRLQKENLDLVIQTSAGSVEALQLLQEGKVDLAFVQGGVANAASKETLHSIGSLFYEPLWVFYRNELQPVNYLHELRGKRLAIGQEGSGSRALVSQLLADNKINTENTTLLGLTSEEASKQLENEEIDAAFFVMSPVADVVAKLARNPDITIMNFQRHANAYTSRYPFLNSLVVSEGLLDIENNIPEHEAVLLTATAALVASKDIHSDHVRLLSREAIYIHSKPGLFEKARQFPSINHLEIPIHPDAEQYLQQGPSWLEKIFPFSIASKLDQLKILLIPLLTLLIPLIKGILPLYQWRTRSKTYRWYKELNEVDRQLDSFDHHVIDQEIDKLTQLHSELAKEVSVPLSHMSEFYELRTHTDHILNRLKERQAFLLSQLMPDKQQEISVKPEAFEPLALVSPQATEEWDKDKPKPDSSRQSGNNSGNTSDNTSDNTSGNKAKREKQQVPSKESIAYKQADSYSYTRIPPRIKQKRKGKKGKKKTDRRTVTKLWKRKKPQRVPAKQRSNKTTVKEGKKWLGGWIIKLWKKASHQTLSFTQPGKQSSGNTKIKAQRIHTIVNQVWKKKKKELPLSFQQNNNDTTSESQDKPEQVPTVEPVETRLQATQTSTDLKKYQQAKSIVRKHMVAGMSLSLLPVPLLDIAALTGTQLNLLHSLSDHYGVDFDEKKGKSLLVSMLGGSLPTTAIMGLSSITKIVPGIGTLGGSASLSAMAGAVIYATGKVFIKHFENGGNLHDFDAKQQRKPFRQAVKSGLTIKAEPSTG